MHILRSKRTVSNINVKEWEKGMKEDFGDWIPAGVKSR
jgi:hypothetical protein